MNLMIAGFLISAAGYLLNAIAGANMALLYSQEESDRSRYGYRQDMLVGLVLIEYEGLRNEWKGIHRMDGTMGSINGLASKVGAAIGTGALGILLSAVGYSGDAANMPGAAITMIRLLYGIVPMILYLLTALTLKGYKLNKMMPQIKADNEARRAEAAKNK